MGFALIASVADAKLYSGLVKMGLLLLGGGAITAFALFMTALKYDAKDGVAYFGIILLILFIVMFVVVPKGQAFIEECNTYIEAHPEETEEWEEHAKEVREEQSDTHRTYVPIIIPRISY